MRTIIALILITVSMNGQSMSVSVNDSASTNSKIGRYLVARGSLVAMERIATMNTTTGGYFEGKSVVKVEAVVLYDPLGTNTDTVRGIAVSVEQVNVYSRARSSYVDIDDLDELINMIGVIKKRGIDVAKNTKSYRQLLYTTADNLAVGFWFEEGKNKPTYCVRAGGILTELAKLDSNEFETLLNSIVRAHKLLAGI